MTIGAMQWLLQQLQELRGTPDADSIHFALYDFHHFSISIVFSTCRFALYDFHHFSISIVFSTCRKVMVEANQVFVSNLKLLV